VKKHLVAFVAGLIFALGLGISGMTHATKVLGFLDFAGDWDPSLALVMGGGVAVNLVLFQWVLRRGSPVLATSFSLPTPTRVDAALIGGSALFGIGWGLGGFCPGPALVDVVTGAAPVVAFVVAMLAGMALFDVAAGRWSAQAPAPGEAAPAGERID
jgi:uncharacterized membrane protein YedE/YeeE